MLYTLTFISMAKNIFSPVFTALDAFIVYFRTEPINKCNNKCFFSLFFVISSWRQTKSQEDHNKQLVSDTFNCKNCDKHLRIQNFCLCNSYTQDHEKISFKHFWMVTISLSLPCLCFLLSEKQIMTELPKDSSLLETFQ